MKNIHLHAARRGFTLIELLVVIAIIAILAGLLLSASGAIKNKAVKKRAETELQQVALAINAYKSKLGFYPPDNQSNFARNTLYYELVGCLRINGGAQYEPLDRSPTKAAAILGGIMNASAGGDSDSGNVAQSFLKEIKPAQYAEDATSGNMRRLGVTLDGPAGSMIGNLSPFRYNSSNPAHNTTSFDLWVDIVVAGKTNRISNWGPPAVL